MVSNLVWVTSGQHGKWNSGRGDADVGCAAGHGKGRLLGVSMPGTSQGRLHADERSPRDGQPPRDPRET